MVLAMAVMLLLPIVLWLSILTRAIADLQRAPQSSVTDKDLEALTDLASTMAEDVRSISHKEESTHGTS